MKIKIYSKISDSAKIPDKLTMPIYSTLLLKLKRVM